MPSPLPIVMSPGEATRTRSGSIELPSMEELEELGIDLGSFILQFLKFPISLCCSSHTLEWEFLASFLFSSLIWRI